MNHHVDLSFALRGRTVPRDHGYALYGALSRCIPGLHGAGWIAVHGIAAKQLDAGRLALDPGGSLRVRVPADKIGELMALVGKTLDIAGSPVEVGAPRVYPLVPAATLDARLVVIRLTGGIPKPFMPAAFELRFVAEAQRQLARHGIVGALELSGRQRVTVAGQRALGYSVRVHGLSAEHSILLQIHGLGGKRAMGCGIFRPARIREGVRKAA